MPAPHGLMAELYVPKPTETWAELRKLVGGPAVLLPSTYPMLATMLLGFSSDVAGLVDAHIPVVGVLLDAGKGRPVAVIGLHVVSGRELVADLTTGKNARYHPRLDKPSGVTVLDPVHGKAPEGMSLGLVGNYLLVSDTSEHLVTGGPFVARTLPKRKIPSESITLVVPKTALSGPVAAKLRQAWADYRTRLRASQQRARAQHGGRPADFANPAAALSGANDIVQSLIEVLSSARELRVVVEPGTHHLQARLELEPGKSGAAEQFVRGMATGSAVPLLALPQGTAFALLERTTAPSRQASAQSTRDAIEKLLGSRLDAAERQQLEKTLGDLVHGRSDVLTYALVLGAGHASLALESSVADPKAFEHGVHELVGLLRFPAFLAPIEQFVGRVSLQQSTAHVAGISGSVNRVLVRLTSNHASSSPPPKPFSCLWTIQDGMLYATVGRDSNAALPELIVAARDKKSLGSDPEVAAALRAAKNVSFAILVDPSKLGFVAVRSAGAAPVLLSVGQAHGEGVVRLYLARAALEGGVRALMNRR